MKYLAILILLITLCFCCIACSPQESVDILATTGPVYDFTTRLCNGTGLSVSLLITENISCLHDYTLQVRQMRLIQSADLIAISGAGLESFLDDAMYSAQHIIDASANLTLMDGHQHDHSHDHNAHAGHLHEEDPHIWLSVENAKQMAENLCNGLSDHYPEYSEVFLQNLNALIHELDELQAYGEDALRDLSCRSLITFHDGFSYLAEAFDLTILTAIEEESGSEASAAQLAALANLIHSNNIPAIFTEINGSASAADILSAETGVKQFALDMAISTYSYIDTMYYNINTLREALQ